LGKLGAAVEQKRLEAGLTQEELASASGLHVTHVRGLERGVRNSTYETLLRLVDGLGIKLSELVALAESKTASR
jgi:transcriptional regulator with XRE-family HTH domain